MSFTFKVDEDDSLWKKEGGHDPLVVEEEGAWATHGLPVTGIGGLRSLATRRNRPRSKLAGGFSSGEIGTDPFCLSGGGPV